MKDIDFDFLLLVHMKNTKINDYMVLKEYLVAR